MGAGSPQNQPVMHCGPQAGSVGAGSQQNQPVMHCGSQAGSVGTGSVGAGSVRAGSWQRLMTPLKNHYEAPYTQAVHPEDVPEHSQHGVVCEWEQGVEGSRV